MSYKTEFASNNADLQTILDKVNSLPDKAKGCKVHVKPLTETGPYSYATVTIGDTTYYATTDKNPNTIVEVESGTEITLLVKGTASIASKSYIAIDGEKVVSAAGLTGVSYAYTVTKDITVELNAGVETFNYGFINVVTGEVDGEPDISLVPETESTFVPTDSGGTSYKSKFADNNMDLRAMLAKIEELGAVALIEFTIYGATLQAEEGMTWNEWCSSTYNTVNAVAYSDHVQFDGGEWMGAGLVNANGNNINPSDIIEAGYAYSLG